MIALILAACGALVLVPATLVLGRRRLMVITVTGRSMVPAYHPGDRVLAWRTRRLRPGQAAVARVSYVPGLVVKRVAALPGDDVPESVRGAVRQTIVPRGKVVLIGDNALSGDSRLRGFWATDDVVGVVLCRVHDHQGG
jgi:signal peptidase I